MSARERGTSPRKLAADLRAVGVLPVTGPGVDGGRQAFFRKGLVEDGSGTGLKQPVVAPDTED